MRRYYLKISRRLRPYAAQVAKLEDDWRRMIFDDLTRGGRELRIVPVVGNEQGPLIGLCGETFFCHAGQDRHNPSSLFISRISPADLRPGKESPARIQGEFSLLTELHRDPEPGESVRPLFEQMGVTSTAVPTVTAPHEPSTPSDVLLGVLSAVDPNLRQRWLDGEPALANGQEVELLPALRQLWNRFGLERFAEPEPRPLALLKGTIMPPKLSQADCRDLGLVFGIATLNAMVQGQAQSPALGQQVLALLEELSSLPLDPSVRTEIGAALTKASTSSGLGTAQPDSVSRWVLAQCGVDRQELEERVHVLTAAIDAWRNTENRMSSAGDVIALLKRLGELSDRMSACMEWLPAVHEIEQRKRDAEIAYLGAQRLLEGQALRLVELYPTLSRDALLDVAELARAPERVARLPPWLWNAPAEVMAGSHTERMMGLARELAEPAQYARIGRARATVQALEPGVVELLRNYPPPARGMDPEAHLERAVHELGQLGQRLGPAAGAHLGWIPRVLGQAWTMDQVMSVVAVMETLGKRLAPDALAGLVADLGEYLAQRKPPASTEVHARLEAYGKAIDRIESLLGSAHDAPWTQIVRLVGREVPAEEKRAPAPAAVAKAPPMPVIRLDDNWVDERRSRVPLVLVPHDDRERPYGMVSVPLVVRAQDLGQGRDLDLDLQFEVKSSLHDHWPESWDRPSPASLHIAASQWRFHDQEAIHTFALEVPLRRPKSGKESVEITISAADPRTRLPLCKPKQLRWQRVIEWQGDIPFAWPDTVRTEYVREHPIGPQERYEDIVQRLVHGGSFAVIAPRRFGKTTLVEYLYERAQEQSLAIAPPVVCTSVTGESGMDYGTLWQRVSSGLERILGVGMALPQSEPLPDEHAFDAVSQAAAHKGYKAVVVLFDEAQLLFPQQGGDRLGDAFKDRIERFWSRAQDSTRGPGRVPVVFGFIGLPGLRERAGANFMGILRPYEGREIEERALNRLILQVTRERLSTTREARQALTSQSGNLYILKTLLDRLVRHVNRKRRTWAALQDVMEVEAEIRGELERGADHNLTQYMRDPLNESEDINEWRPRPCFPVAVAMAACMKPRRGDEPLAGMDTGVQTDIDEIRAMLQGWAHVLGYEGQKALVFSPGRVEEHMATLADLGLVSGGAFVSAIFRSWLVGVARTFPRTEIDRQALVRAALERVRLPGSLEPVSVGQKGGHYRFIRDGVAYVLHKVVLASEADQQRFAERAKVLRIIQQRQQLRDPGAEYIYGIVTVGLSERDDVGVEIYPWIDGVPLDERVGQLDAALIADLGNKLAVALRLLHEHGIVHGDICPEHIVLERASMRPILIDVGLWNPDAGAPDAGERNKLRPPELRSGRSQPMSQPTRAADIYAFGATLESLWNQAGARPEETEALEELIAACKRERPEDRINAQALVHQLDELSEILRVYQRQEQAWQTLQEAARVDLDKRWFRELMEKFRPKFVAILYGLHANLFERSCEMALFLDQVLEAHPASAAELNLGRVKHRNEDTNEDLIAPSIELLHALRQNAAHYRQGLPRSKLEQKFGIHDEERLRELVIDGARRIGTFAAVTSLPRVAEIVLSAE